jgi:hypothetical protein
MAARQARAEIGSMDAITVIVVAPAATLATGLGARTR